MSFAARVAQVPPRYLLTLGTLNLIPIGLLTYVLMTGSPLWVFTPEALW